MNRDIQNQSEDLKGIADNESRNQNDYKERRNTNKSTKPQEISER